MEENSSIFARDRDQAGPEKAGMKLVTIQLQAIGLVCARPVLKFMGLFAKK